MQAQSYSLVVLRWKIYFLSNQRRDFLCMKKFSMLFSSCQNHFNQHWIKQCNQIKETWIFTWQIEVPRVSTLCSQTMLKWRFAVTISIIMTIYVVYWQYPQAGEKIFFWHSSNDIWKRCLLFFKTATDYQIILTHKIWH